MKRKEGEDFEAYKERRRKENKFIKQTLKGKIFWDNKNKGTYRKDK